MVQEDDVLPRPSLHFCQHFMPRTTEQTLLAINLASQQKTTKLYFSSQVRKQFKLLTVPFKPLRCCLRSDKDLFLNLRVIWSVNQIVLFNGFLSNFVRSLRVYILKQSLFSISVNSGFRKISHYSPRFQRIIVTIKIIIMPLINLVTRRGHPSCLFLKASENKNGVHGYPITK